MGLFDGGGLFGRRNRDDQWHGRGGRISGQENMTVAPLYPESTQKYDAALQGALGQLGQADGTGTAGQTLIPGAEQYLQGQIAGDYIDANPWLEAQYQTGADDIRNDMAKWAQQTGSYGNPQTAGVFGRALGNYRNNLFGQQYQFDRNLQHNAAMGLPNWSSGAGASQFAPYIAAGQAMAPLQNWYTQEGTSLTPHTPFLNFLNAGSSLLGNIIGLGGIGGGGGIFGGAN